MMNAARPLLRNLRLIVAPAMAQGGVFWLSTASAADSPAAPRNVEGIRDNSFFVEEAYNQEPGVVQHIFTLWASQDKLPGDDEERYDFAFTQEWPVFGMTHQFGFTLPYGVVANGRRDSGLGDLLLNYRYQAYFDAASLTAFAPRASLILPTGDDEDGFGEDTVGGQLNLPFSTTVGDDWFVHLNAGTTYLPDAASAGDRDLWHWHLGASAIYAPTPDLHFLLEWVGQWEEGANPGGHLDHEFSAILSPGVRKAVNFSNGSQLVAGVAVPIGLTGSAPDYGAFFYLSYEHSFRRKGGD